jgi:hypothetical protein
VSVGRFVDARTDVDMGCVGVGVGVGVAGMYVRWYADAYR